MALALILFCVFQVMLAVVTASPPRISGQPFNIGSQGSPKSTNMSGLRMNDTKHDKRSLVLNPFAPRYLCLQDSCLNITENGIVGVPKFTPPGTQVEYKNACNLPDAQQDMISIVGTVTGLYICFNENGVLYTSPNCTDECNFIREQTPLASQSYFKHVKYKGPKPKNKRLGFEGTVDENERERQNRPWYLAMRKGKGLKGFRNIRAEKKEKLAGFFEWPVDEFIKYAHIVGLDFKTDNNGQVSLTQSGPEEEHRNSQNPLSAVSPPSQEKPGRNKKGRRRGKNRKKKRRRDRQGRRQRAKKTLDDSQPDPLRIFRVDGRRSTSRRRDDVLSKRDMTGGLFQTVTRQSNSRQRPGSRTRTPSLNLFSSIT